MTAGATVGEEPTEAGETVALAARPAPGRILASDEAELDPGTPGPITDRLGETGAPSSGNAPGVTTWAARLTGPAGHVVYARLRGHGAAAASGGAHTGPESLKARLGRALWSELRAKPGDPVTVEPLELEACEHVTIQSELVLSDTLADRAVDNLRGSAPVVWSNAVFALPLLGEGSEVTLVVTSCDADPGVIGPDTRIRIVESSAGDHGHRHGGDDISHRPPVPATRADVGGAGEALARLMGLLDTALNKSWLYTALGVRPPRGVLLYGPPGTGKTLLARVVASDVGAHVIALSSAELVGTFSGETEANLRKLFQRAAEHAPTLILIDEIDVLTTKRDRLASMADVRAASQLLALLDGVGALGRVVVLGTTNRLAAIDEAFRRPGRFDVEIAVLPPDEPGRREILAVHTRDMPLTQGAEQGFDRFLAAGSAGMTGADLMSFAREVSLHAAHRLSVSGIARLGAIGSSGAEQARLVAIEAEDVAAASKIVKPSLLRGMRVSADEAELGWEEIVGLDEEKEELDRVIAEVFSAEERAGEGVLLSGAPGSGKTMLLRVLAKRAGATYVEVDGTAVFTQWLGESEAELRAAFARAREVRPVVVGLEHLEVLAPHRGAHLSGEATRAGDRVLGALLSELDATLRQGHATVVGVTDRPDLVDPAVLRAGRLGLHIELGAPSPSERKQLIRSVLDGAVAPGELEDLLARTDGMAAAAVIAEARRLGSKRRKRS